MRMKLTILALPALASLAVPAAAQEGGVDAAITRERIVACSEDRRAEGCATVLIRLLVCERAPDLPGCAEINDLVEEVAETADTEAQVEPEAEGALVEDEDGEEDEGGGDDEGEADDETDEEAEE